MSKCKTYFCIDFPGFVKNDSEAIRTLGGMNRIEQIFQRKNSKLLLNFTPDNIFSKMLCSSQIETPPQSTNLQSSPIKSNGDSALAFKTSLENDNIEQNTSNISRNSQINDLITMPCFILSVKKQKQKETNRKPEELSDDLKFKTEFYGKIEKIYTFQKLCDFQYLPMSSASKSSSICTNNNKETNKKSPQISPSKCSNSNSNESLAQLSSSSKLFQFNAFYDNFRFNLIDNYEQDLRRSNIPQLFVLPPFFSRFDDPVNYSFKSEPTKKTNKSQTSPTTSQSQLKASSNDKKSNENINDLSSSQESTTSGTKQGDESEKSTNNKELSFSDSDTTQSESIKISKEESTSGLIRSMRQERSSQAFLVTFNCKQIPNVPNEKLKPVRNETICDCIVKLEELFEKRPIYLKSVLLCITTFSPSTLKESLPYVAYYFTTGPWRSCWVKYGYDPRLNPEAKIYQMIDYRLRYYAEPDQIVKAKPRSSYHKRKFISDLSESESDEYKNFKFEEEMYKFKPDKLPISRNVFYQICDIEDEDVQNLIKSEQNKPNECSEKDGWCLNNIQDKCRDIMSKKHEKLSKMISNEQKETKKNKTK